MIPTILNFSYPKPRRCRRGVAEDSPAVMKSSRSVAGSYSEKGCSLADADQAAFGNGLFLLLFTGFVFHMRSNGTTGQVQAELLTAASSEQAVHIQPGEVIQKDERRRVPGEPIADVGGAAMDQGAIQFDEAELQGGKHWEMAIIHSVEQIVIGRIVKVGAMESRVDVSQPLALLCTRDSEIVGSKSTGSVGDEELLASHGGAVHGCDQIVTGIPDPQLLVDLAIVDAHAQRLPIAMAKACQHFGHIAHFKLVGQRPQPAAGTQFKC